MSDPVFLGEVFSLTTYDDLTLVFEGDVRLLAWGYFGATRTNWITRRGYKQHGSTEVDFLLEDRRLSLTLWHRPETIRQDYWNTRSRLLEFFRHNRGGQLTLTILLPNGDQRAIRCRADPGPQYAPLPPDQNNWNIEEQIDLVAFDPIWYDPTPHSLDLTGYSNPALVFPITFPITFSTTAPQFTTGSLAYGGTWDSYPTITLTGPYSSARLEHITLNIIIYLNVTIGIADQRIVTLQPGQQSIVDGAGANKFGELGPGSNLVDFRLIPAPVAAGGVNEIRVTLLGGDLSASAVNVSYYDRYYGL